ncbi:dynein heavy chain 9, axonemal [Pontoporia blainvillei]|uniref:Dynein heavy chain 9, axonemal n=1 Tax=Pontoporia blainvillei TaxID=48723 RepID=A0ABX0RYT9_PONBL|nr:dynein heavy chain 9, axonemal [Pontoporia blainvillei]
MNVSRAQFVTFSLSAPPVHLLFLDSMDKSVMYAIESAVIQWSHQVQVVLKRESSQPLLQGENPTPQVELEFWKRRSEDLEYIYNQLRTVKVRGMAGLLHKLQSSYFPAFQAMFRDVVAALMEARDIHTHLVPLHRHLETLESLEFPEVKPWLWPLLHVVCLIWATCELYRCPGRLMVLLQEICNLLVQQEFENDVSEFNQRVEDLDRRLGTVFIQAFDDAPGLEHAFKLLDIAGNLLERPLVARNTSDKYLVLIHMFSEDLDAVRMIYSQHVQEEVEHGQDWQTDPEQ